MLPRNPRLDAPLPRASPLRSTTFERELEAWFRVAAVRPEPAPGPTTAAETMATWPDEPSSARIPFLMF